MSTLFILGVFTVFLFLIELIFLSYARKKRIYDSPNERSSHIRKTIRGGGIVNWFAALIFFISEPDGYWLFFTGITIVSVISFTDDIHNLGQWPRFFSHVTGITFVILFLNNSLNINIFDSIPWYFILSGYILFVGILNAYNFMDGINGINGLYSISVLGALQYVNIKITSFADPLFIWVPIVACIVFLFFNFRKKALCFAGDVGSISIAFWIVTLIAMLIVKTGNIVWLLLLAVYGIDSIFTIVQRLYLRQNIFEAHRMHFYQVLANECGIDHRIVSTLYALLQCALSLVAIMLWDRVDFYLLSAMILTPLAAVYFLKFRLMKGESVKR